MERTEKNRGINEWNTKQRARSRCSKRGNAIGRQRVTKRYKHRGRDPEKGMRNQISRNVATEKQGGDRLTEIERS